MEFQQDAMSAAKPAMFMEDDTDDATRSFNPRNGDHCVQPTEPLEDSGQQRQNRMVASRLSVLGEHILSDESGELFASNPASDPDRHSSVASASSSESEQQEEHNDERKQPAKPGAMSVSGADAANALYARKDRSYEKVSAEIDLITSSWDHKTMSDGEDQGQNTEMLIEDNALTNQASETSSSQSQLSTKARAATPGAVFVSDADAKISSSGYSQKVARGRNDVYIPEDREAAKVSAMQHADNVEDRMVQARMSILGEHILHEGSESTLDPIRQEIVSTNDQWKAGEVLPGGGDHNDAPGSLSVTMEASANESAGAWESRAARPRSKPPIHPSNEHEMTSNDDVENGEYIQSEGHAAIGGEATFSLSAGVVVPQPMPPQEMAPPLKKDDLERGLVDKSEELITAKPVDEEDFEVKLEKEMEDRIKNQTVMALAIAEEHEDGEDEIPKTLWRRYRLPCIGLFLVLVVVAIALGLTVGGDSGPLGPSQRLSPTSSPTAAPTVSDEHYLREILTLASSEADLLDPSTPQHQAMQWLINEDPASLPLRETNPERLRERYILAVLYSVTGGPAWTDNSNFLSEKSVCEWVGVFCGNENSIVDLDFRKCM